MAKAYHSYFTKSISLHIKIQITIHPLSTDGAVVILVFFSSLLVQSVSRKYKKKSRTSFFFYVHNFQFVVVPDAFECLFFFVRDRPIICMDLQIQTAFGFRWVGGFEEAGYSDFGPENNPVIIERCTDFLCRECSNLGVYWWAVRNPNNVRICKSLQIIGRSFRNYMGKAVRNELYGFSHLPMFLLLSSKEKHAQVK